MSINFYGTAIRKKYRERIREEPFLGLP